MAKLVNIPPSAASLSASLRDLGYSLETAVADLIDNSISADATAISIFCVANGDTPVLVITDNGRGMSEAEVLAAMRHGSTDPRKERSPKDLGRFGLGLKTASFSQCRRLTVISSRNGERSGAEWNLAKLESEDDWLVSVLEPDEIAAEPFIQTLKDTGTVVIWRDLDRLLEDEKGQKRDEIVNEKLSLVERHLSLVFHRFLSGEDSGRKKISISINGHPVAAFDPFCRKNPATQILPEETVWIRNTPVVFQPYILPHHSRLSPSEFDFYQDRSNYISNQGTYVYRNGRLIAWGDWFRLVPKGEATKLARVQIDFSNSLDNVWTIDIKKSRARPPVAVLERLRQIIPKIIDRSVTVHRGRGVKLFQETKAPVWDRYADHGGIRFAVNMQHPLIMALAAKMSVDDARGFKVLLDSISASLPVEMIYSDYSTHPREVCQSLSDEKQMIDRLNALRHLILGDGPGDPKTFMQIVRSTRLFDGQIEKAEKFIIESFT